MDEVTYLSSLHKFLWIEYTYGTDPPPQTLRSVHYSVRKNLLTYPRVHGKSRKPFGFRDLEDHSSEKLLGPYPGCDLQNPLDVLPIVVALHLV